MVTPCAANLKAYQGHTSNPDCRDAVKNPPLESEFQRELNLPGGKGRPDGAERSAAPVRSGRPEIRRVEKVEGLHSELHP